jgi:transcriptional regulator with XRE-family HTH domain
MKNTLGERLKDERYRLGYNLEDFATLGGVGKSTQARYEVNEAKPDAEYLNKISAKGAEIFWILKGEKEDDEMRDKTMPIYPPRVRDLIENYKRCPVDVQEAIAVMAKNSAIKKGR